MEPSKHIVIADPDIEYIKKLEKDFVKKFYSIATIQIITEAEYLENYFRLHRDIDILLIAMEFNGPYLNEHNIRHMFLLNEKRSTRKEGDESGRALRHKQNEEIISFVDKSLLSDESLSSDFTELAGEKEKPSVKVISVYSPVGGSGKSLSALALAKKLKKLGESVLVIGCDDLQSFGAFLETRDNAEPELSECIKNFTESTYWVILKNIYSGEVAYLLPFEKSLSALCIGAEQIYDLINLLKEKKDFSYIILDLGSTLDKVVQTMMSISDACVLISESKMSSCRMLEKFMINTEYLSIQKLYIIVNQYRTEGIRLENENFFGSLAGYKTASEAMEDPVFYSLALALIDL